jgi:hypothetical protein
MRRLPPIIAGLYFFRYNKAVVSHKISGTVAGNTVLEPTRHNSPPAKAVPSSVTVKPPLAPMASSAVPRSISALIADAGLPADKLTASIVSFARFFALPLKPEMMAAIRRQVLSSSTAAQSNPVKLAAAENVSDSGTAAKNREALSLAAAAAESKGLELHPRGLEVLAEALDPDWQKRQEERNQHRRRNKRHDEQENSPKAGAISASSLKEMALESAEKDPLLAIFNRLPSKNGQRWVALPFSFSVDGRKFNVSLRILLEPDYQAANQVSCGVGLMALDIAEGEKKWLFVFDNRNMAAKLAVYLQPELPPRDIVSFTSGLSRLMEIPPERIFVRNRAESFPCEAGCAKADGGDIFRSIDEAV